MSFLKILSILPLRFRFFRYLEKVSSIYQGKGWDSGTVTSEINACLSLLQIKPKIFIDIGANKGVYSRYILKKFDEALGQRQLTDYRLLDMRYSKQLVAREWI